MRLLQQGTGTGTTTTCAVTLAATAGGSTLIAAISTVGTGVASIAPGTWALVQSGPLAHNGVELWIGTGVAAGTTTITITFNVTETTGANISEWDTLASSAADTHTNGSGADAAPTAGPITPTLAENLVIGVATTAAAASAGPSGGFTALTSVNFTGAKWTLAGYLIQHTATAATIGWTLGSAAGWDSVIGAFKGVPSMFQTDEPTDQMAVAG